MISVLLADDHGLVRQALSALLCTVPDMRVVGEASDGVEALRLAEELRPHVLLLDRSMPRMNGLEALPSLARSCPDTRTVIVTMHADEAGVLEAYRGGAAGYVLKDSSADTLLDAIRQAASGGPFVSPEPSHAVAAGDQNPQAALTAREREVLGLAVQGFGNRDIAARLSISARTVEVHRARIHRKLGIASQAELIRFGLRHGMLPVG